MTREPLIETLRRHGADPQFDVASFRCGVITDKAGQRLKWHYGGSDCSYVSSQKAYGSHRLRIIDNLVLYLRIDAQDRCERCSHSATKG